MITRSTISRILMLLCLLSSGAQATAYYFGGGDINNLSNWRTERHSGSSPASFSNPGDVFYIQGSLENYTTAAMNFSGSGQTLIIEDNASLQANHPVTIPSDGTLMVLSGGQILYNNTGDPATTIFNGTELLDPSWIFRIDNWINNSTPIPADIEIGNLIINLTGVTSWGNWSVGSTLQTIRGYLKVDNSGGYPVAVNSSSLSVTIGGDLIVTGGTFYMPGSTKICGSFNQTGGTVMPGQATSFVYFAGSGKTFTQSGGTLSTTDMYWTVNDTASLTLNSNLDVIQSCAVYGTLNCNNTVLTGPGIFWLKDGGKLGIDNSNGITSSGSTGSIQTTTRTFSQNAKYSYYGAARSTGDALPSAVDSLIVDIGSPNTLTLTSSITINKALTLTSGTFSNSAGTTLTNGSTLTRGTGSFSSAPTYGTSSTDRVNLKYTSTATATYELLGSPGYIDTISVAGGTVTLNNNTTCKTLIVNDGAAFGLGNSLLTVLTKLNLETTGRLSGNGGSFTLNGSGEDVNLRFDPANDSLRTLTFVRGGSDYIRLYSSLRVDTLSLTNVNFLIGANTLKVNCIISHTSSSFTGGIDSKLEIGNGPGSFTIWDYLELYSLTINKDVTLGGDVSIKSMLKFNAGKIFTGNTSLLSLANDTAHIDGASSSSYVVGNLSLFWITPFPKTKTYYTGSSDAYRPITLEITSSGFFGMPGAPVTIRQYDSTHAMTSHDAAIGDISNKRFWKITKDGMTSWFQANITFPWGSDDGISSLSNVRVARENALTENYWQHDNFESITGTTSSGSITYSSTINATTDWALATAAPAPPIINTSKTDYTAGTYPYAVAIGDLNGDRKPDMAVANQSSGTVSVFLNGSEFGGSTPYFTAKTDFTAGSNPHAIAIGDLNNDGKLDIAVPNFGSATISVFINTTALGVSEPTFSTKFDFTTGNVPTSVALCDFNMDGRLDMAVTSSSGNVVDVLINTTSYEASTPTFDARASYATGSGPYSVAVADINLDGKPDITTANNNDNTVSVLLNTTTPGNASASFAAHVDISTGSNPRSVALDDLNNDGKPDMAVAINGSTVVSVFLNTTASGAASPTFSSNTDFTAGDAPMSVALQDMNGDGLVDIAVANSGSTTVSTFINKTPSGSAAPSFADASNATAGTNPYSVAIRDLNGDGKPDMVTANYNSANVSVLLSNTNMGSPVSFLDKQDVALGYNTYSIVAGDLNADGKPDIATLTSNNCVSVNLNSTTFGSSVSSFSSNTDFATGTNPISLTLGDINSDGKPDLAAVLTSGTISAFINTTVPAATDPSFTTITDIVAGTSAKSIALGDLNCDGKPDLVIANDGHDSIAVLLNTSTTGSVTFATRVDFATGSTPNSVAICDINGDGKSDIVATNNSSNTISVFMNTTTSGSSIASFSAKSDFATANSPYSVASGDLNGDGIPDIAVVNTLDDNVSVFLNNTVPGSATPSFVTRKDFSAGNEACAVSIGDINGDGKLDLAVVNHLATSVSILLNTTPAGNLISSFAAPTDYTSGTEPWAIAIQDFNCDGKTDLAVANRTGNSVSILLNGFTPLPVEMTSFTAMVQGATAQLQWQTETEVNNYGFNIERRKVDEQTNKTVNNDLTTQWLEVGFVSGAGTSNTPKEYSFTDAKLAGGRYAYRLKQIDNNGAFKYSQSVEVEIGLVPKVFTLSQNYPNPFNPTTTIEFTLKDDGMTTLKVYDILGREVAVLVNENLKAGILQQVTLNASRFSSGVYFYRLESGKTSLVKKLVLMK